MRFLWISLLCLASLTAVGQEKGMAVALEPNRIELTTDDTGVVTEKIFERAHLIKKTVGKGTRDEAIWMYEYSEHGQLLSECDPRGNKTSWLYDGPKSKEPSQVKLPDGTIKDLRLKS